MRGVARAAGAISVVNALPTGTGCAIGIERFATATAEISEAAVLPVVTLNGAPASPFIEAVAKRALECYAPDEPLSVNLVVRSELPVSRGLKSSSAVSTAIIGAIARAVDRPTDPREVARLSARAARESGVSATGAYDDALAGLRPGFLVTDNRRDELVRADPVDADWVALLYVPSDPHRPSSEWKEAFHAVASEAEAIAEHARRGDYLAAMEANSDLVERVVGYHYRHLRETLRSAGALATGVSGMGPTLAAIVPRDRVDAAIAALPDDRAERFSVAFLRHEPLAEDRPE